MKVQRYTKKNLCAWTSGIDFIRTIKKQKNKKKFSDEIGQSFYLVHENKLKCL